MAFEDILYPFVNIYNRIPTVFKLPLGFLYRKMPLRWRYGKVYKKYFWLLKKSPFWSDAEVNAYTINCLRETFINAFKSSSYYNNLFNSIGFDPYKFDNLDDLSQVPFSDKEILRKNKDALISNSIPKNKLLYVTTGGTSGIPVEVYFTKGTERSKEFVFMTDQWSRIGYRYGDRIARIRGTVIDHKGSRSLFKYEPIKNRLYLSTFDLTEENFDLFVQKLIKFRPHFIHTYPSVIEPLAKYILTKNLRIGKLKGILCSSEQFYPGQRETIEKAFCTRIFSWYGHTENSTLAGECEINSQYHIYHEYGYTELIDDRGEIIKEPGIRGEIVGTSYDMKAFPIIRYRTGDYAEYVHGKCKCGRNYRLMTNVIGRWHQEMIITKKDHGISLTALNMHSDIFDNVIQFQFHQKEKGKVILKIIKGENFKLKDEEKIYRAYREKFKNMVDLEILYVNKIPRTIRGKHKFLIQELQLD